MVLSNLRKYRKVSEWYYFQFNWAMRVVAFTRLFLFFVLFFISLIIFYFIRYYYSLLFIFFNFHLLSNYLLFNSFLYSFIIYFLIFIYHLLFYFISFIYLFIYLFFVGGVHRRNTSKKNKFWILISYSLHFIPTLWLIKGTYSKSKYFASNLPL